MGDRATLTGNQSSINGNTAERVQRVLERLDGVEERGNEVWTNASTESLEGTGGDRAGGITAETTAGIGGNGRSEQQPAEEEREEIGNMGGANNSGNEGVGEREGGS